MQTVITTDDVRTRRSPGRPRFDSVTLTLPGTTADRLREYCAWYEVIRAAGVEKIMGRVAVTVRAPISERDGDLDALTQRVLVTLVACGVIESGGLTRIVSERSSKVKRGSIQIE